jgi:ubiquinone/menaquinone biosynthesis C-methylase UbiE
MRELDDESLKARVRAFWENETCDTRYGVSVKRARCLAEIEQARYALEPYIPGFAGFAESSGKRVLEIGVGAGTDFHNWVQNGAIAVGTDLTESAVNLTRERLDLSGVPSESARLNVADVENLPFSACQFDLVYAWGVLHHTPRTEIAFREAWRVLKEGGTLKAMIYHIPSWTGWMLWIWNGVFKGRPLLTVRQAISLALESPGTKAYTISEARDLLEQVGFTNIQLTTRLGPADLLKIKPSQKYRSFLFRLVWQFYPRWLIRAIGDQYGLALLIRADRPIGV